MKYLFKSYYAISPLKLTLLICVLMGIDSTVLAQDVITLRTGEEITSKVLEIGEENIRYKKWSNLEGPTFVVTTSKVFFIKFENGDKEIINPLQSDKVQENESEGPKVGLSDKDKELKLLFGTFKNTYQLGYDDLSKDQFLDLLKRDANSYNDFIDGRSFSISGQILAYPAAAVFGFSIGFGGDTYLNALLISGGVMAGGLALTYYGRSKMKKAINQYNDSGAISLRIGHTSAGIGVSVTF